METINNTLKQLQLGRTGNDAALDKVEKRLAAMVAAERGGGEKVPIKTHMLEQFKEMLDKAGLKSGVIAEVGGAKNTFLRDALPGFELEFVSIFPMAGERHVVADITHCPHIPDNTYDAVFSTSVLEHVTRPADAAKEIYRITKPGGITYHSAPFSYFFHGAPVDFFRYTTSAMEFMFRDFEPLESKFFMGNRRRDNRGSPRNPIDRDGGPEFAVDAFGGWRENIQTIFAGRKSEEWQQRRQERERHQFWVDAHAALKTLHSDSATLRRELHATLRSIGLDHDGRIVFGRFRPPAMSDLWGVVKGRISPGLTPTFHRNIILSMLQASK